MSKKEKNKRVSLLLIKDKKDNILMGKRNDSGLWTGPGGHCNEGECPWAAAVRELKEETGLDAKSLKLLNVSKNKQGKMIYLFGAEVEGKIDASKDADKECDNWFYVDPIEVADTLHVPAPDNLLIKFWAMP
jgi:ADP-ribose pyrophosphatase YjhB (NUDIX family)